MAKKLITYYTFGPTTNTVKVKGNIPKATAYITNVTDNVNIYNFADNFLGLLEPMIRLQRKLPLYWTLIVPMQSTDELEIFYEGLCKYWTFRDLRWHGF